MKKEEDRIPISAIEEALGNAGPAFTVASVVKTLCGGRSDTLRRRVENVVESDEELFFDEKWRCRTREDFFTGRTFAVTPDEWEIANGVLIPGHRFIPFVPETVFPSSVELKEKKGSAVAKKSIHAPLGKVFHYHILLGSEQIFDFLIADDPANAHLAKHPGANEMVTLCVFDLKDFYAAHRFAVGDALLCTVKSYRGGELTISHLPGSQRDPAKRNARIAALDSAMEQVWEKYEDYLDIPEQLAWTDFYAGEQSDASAASTDEFIVQSRKVELRAEGDHAVLTIHGAAHHHHDDDDECQCGHDHHDHHHDENGDDVELPEGLNISASPLDDPMKILSGAGFLLSAAELDAFMLDAIYAREGDLDGVFSRIFGHTELDLADEAQNAVLMNFLEERFEELSENYNRIDDEPKADLRSRIVETVSQRLDFLAALSDKEGEPGEAEKEKLHRLADVSAKLGEILKMLNSGAFTPSEAELDRLEEMAETLFDQQDELLDANE